MASRSTVQWCSVQFLRREAKSGRAGGKARVRACVCTYARVRVHASSVRESVYRPPSHPRAGARERTRALKCGLRVGRDATSKGRKGAGERKRKKEAEREERNVKCERGERRRTTENVHVHLSVSEEYLQNWSLSYHERGVSPSIANASSGSSRADVFELREHWRIYYRADLICHRRRPRL